VYKLYELYKLFSFKDETSRYGCNGLEQSHMIEKTFAYSPIVGLELSKRVT